MEVRSDIWIGRKMHILLMEALRQAKCLFCNSLLLLLSCRAEKIARFRILSVKLHFTGISVLLLAYCVLWYCHQEDCWPSNAASWMPVLISFSEGGRVQSPGTITYCNASMWVLFLCLKVRMSCSIVMDWKEKMQDCDYILRKMKKIHSKKKCMSTSYFIAFKWSIVL